MEEFQPSSFRSSDRRMDIVSGKGFGANQTYMTARTTSSTNNTAMTTYMPPPAQAQARGNQVAAKPWGFNDPEMRRRKRIAKYKVYTVEGRVKASIRSGLRWIKNKCSEIIHGC